MSWQFEMSGRTKMMDYEDEEWKSMEQETPRRLSVMARTFLAYTLMCHYVWLIPSWVGNRVSHIYEMGKSYLVSRGMVKIIKS